MSYCSKCGSVLLDGAKFCHECGVKLDDLMNNIQKEIPLKVIKQMYNLINIVLKNIVKTKNV